MMLLPADSNTCNTDIPLGLDENPWVPAADQPGTHNHHLRRWNDENIIGFHHRPVYDCCGTDLRHRLRLRSDYGNPESHGSQARAAAGHRPGYRRHRYVCFHTLGRISPIEPISVNQVKSVSLVPACRGSAVRFCFGSWWLAATWAASLA